MRIGSRPAFMMEQREAAVVRRDLRVIATRREGGSRLDGQPRRFSRALDLARKDVGRQRLRGGIGRSR